MKKSVPKSFLKYLYNSLTGSFTGFLIASFAAGLVSKFFATRSIHNLWGLTSHKTILDKTTYNTLEWFVSVLAGFLVFEVFNKVLKRKIDDAFPRLKMKLFRWLIARDLHLKFR